MSMKRILQKVTACALSAICVCGCLEFGGKSAHQRTIKASAFAQYMYGDVTRDGKVNDIDATMILRFYAQNIVDASKNTLFDSEQITLANVNQKDGVNDADAVAVLSYYAQSILGKAPANWAVYTRNDQLTVDSREYPMGISVSQMKSQYGAPSESLSEARKKYTLTYHIYEPASKKFMVAMTADDTVVGYYIMGSTLSNPGTANVTAYRDTLGNGKNYAYLVMQSGYRVSYSELQNLSDLSVYSKICWYVTNALRAREGVAATGWNATAANCALAHSKDMASKNYFDHTSLDGTTFSKRMSNAGINWMSCAENIVGGATHPFEAMDMWLNSDGHRENLLGGYKYLGIGFAYHANATYKIYGTQDFFS